MPNPLHGAIAVLAALLRRRRTGQGCYIELAQLESTANVIGPALVAAAAGHAVGRAGNDDPVAAPHGVYPCAGEDRWCAIAVIRRRPVARRVSGAGPPEWAAEFATAGRPARRPRPRWTG